MEIAEFVLDHGISTDTGDVGTEENTMNNSEISRMNPTHNNNNEI